TGKRVGQADGEHAYGDRGAGIVGAGRLKVAAPLAMNLIDHAAVDSCGKAAHQKALVIVGGGVGRRRAIGDRRGRSIAVGRVEVGEVKVDERVVLRVDVVIQTREEQILLSVTRCS